MLSRKLKEVKNDNSHCRPSAVDGKKLLWSKTCGCIILVVVAIQLTTNQFSFHYLKIIYPSTLHFDRLPGVCRLVTHMEESILLSSSWKEGSGDWDLTVSTFSEWQGHRWLLFHGQKGPQLWITCRHQGEGRTSLLHSRKSSTWCSHALWT